MPADLPILDPSPLSSPAELAGLIAYQSGSVVSRALVQRPTGTVTLFAFDVGQGLSEHTAPYDAIVFVLDGQADVTVAGTLHRVRRGEALRMPGGRPHALHAPEPFKMLLVMIRS
jgi:quercetin dioxygenase-like cupin family protein